MAKMTNVEILPLLGTMSDQALSDLSGKSVSALRAMRARYRVESFRAQRARTGTTQSTIPPRGDAWSTEELNELTVWLAQRSRRPRDLYRAIMLLRMRDRR